MTTFTEQRRSLLGTLSRPEMEAVRTRVETLKPGFRLEVQRCDYADGEASLTDFRLSASMQDPRSGDVAVEMIKADLTETEIMSLAKRLAKELKAKAAATKKRLQAERSVNAE
jgi:hypothetical protein